MSSDWRTNITREYPRALPIDDFRSDFLRWLTDDCDVQPETTLLATSFCADDIIVSKDIGDRYWGPFLAGGLGGYPFGGLTAFSAFAHHVPDHGTALLLYGPHIGMSPEGALGQMQRPGQNHLTASCGSLMSALEQLKSSDPHRTGSASGDDPEQSRLLELLSSHRTRILTAVNPKKEITEVAYELAHAQVERLIAATRGQFHGVRLVAVGGVIINTNPDEPDWLDVRRRSYEMT